jgi:hypothetical protein
MAKQQQVSPENYMRTRARTLPIDACYINVDWKIGKLATVVVLRRHVNGNITSGVYMVDLLCLGIKDTLYSFNQPRNDLEETLGLADNKLWQRIDYDLAHNIIYAGHDFAMEYHIEPHKNFAVTKYILEEDDDKVPVIEVETGDEEGRPHLMVMPTDSYGQSLAKLRKYAGEGNYTFTIKDETTDFDDEGDEDEEDLDDDETEEKDTILDEVEEGFLDFDDVSVVSTSRLLQVLNNHTRLSTEEFIVKAELLLRLYQQESGETVIKDDDEVFKSTAYDIYDKGVDKWNEAFEISKPFLEDMMEDAKNLVEKDGDKNEIEGYLALVDKYSHNEITVCSFLQASPPAIIIQMFDDLLKRFEEHLPLLQLFITAMGLLMKNESIDPYRRILSAENVENAYPTINIHSVHHKSFWLVKALHALNTDNEKSVWHWHNLVRTTGIGGNLKILYAIRFENWLKEKMKLGEDDFPDDSRETSDTRL